jgi:hypothetical protein
MKILGRIVAIAAIAFALPIHAADRTASPPLPPTSVGGPLALNYVVPGVFDNGGAFNAGVATLFHCTNTSTTSENVQIVVRTFDGTIVGNVTFSMASASTITSGTHQTALFTEDVTLSAGTTINQGQAFIFATSQFVFCSAMIVDAAATIPNGIALHMVRFGPLQGTQE